MSSVLVLDLACRLCRLLPIEYGTFLVSCICDVLLSASIHVCPLFGLNILLWRAVI